MYLWIGGTELGRTQPVEGSQAEVDIHAEVEVDIHAEVEEGRQAEVEDIQAVEVGRQVVMEGSQSEAGEVEDRPAAVQLECILEVEVTLCLTCRCTEE